MANSKRRCRLKSCAAYHPVGEMIVINNAAFCNRDCAATYAIQSIPKQKKKDAKAFRSEIFQAKKKLKDNDLRHQIKLTQAVFNQMIRFLDKNQPCISCLRFDHEISGSWVGGKWDCGHYKTRGAQPALKFHPLNAYKQCKSCNGGSNHYSKKGHTVGKDYTDNLVNRMGQDVVDWLEGYHPEVKWTCDQLREMRAEFSAENRRLEAGEPPSKNWRALPDEC